MSATRMLSLRAVNRAMLEAVAPYREAGNGGRARFGVAVA